MINNFLTSIFVILLSFTSPVTTNFSASPITSPKTLAAVAETKEATAKDVYNSIDANSFSLPAFECFSKALKGYEKLKEQGKIKKNYLTVIDFSKSSNTKRLWIIDMESEKVLFNTYVAHGRNSGNEFAKTFSNKPSSYKSSLGFYTTGEIYTGKHGESLRLDGVESGINSNARARAIVMHAADYVSESFIKQNSRLGRSLGCPALPNHLNKKIINLITGKSCLFIYHPNKRYLASSKLLS